MKKFILPLLLTTASCTPAVAEQITVLNGYRVGGSLFRAADSLHNYDPETFSVPESTGNCAKTMSILKNTDKPTIANYGYLDHSVPGDPQCDGSDYFISNYATAYYSICRLTERTDLTLDHLLKETSTTGVASWHNPQEALTVTMQGIGSPTKVVPYKTSKDYLLALEVGEVDYIYTNRPKPSMTCILTTDPDGDIPRAVDLFDHPYSTFSLTIDIIGVNVDKDEIQEKLIEASENEWIPNNPQFTNKLSKQFRRTQLKTYEKLTDVFNNAQ